MKTDLKTRSARLVSQALGELADCRAYASLGEREGLDASLEALAATLHDLEELVGVSTPLALFEA